MDFVAEGALVIALSQSGETIDVIDAMRCPPNVSLTGLAFATGQFVDAAPDFVEITLHIPALGQPIEGVGRLVWREAMEGSHQWGCELLDLLPDSRKGLEDVLANAA